MVLAAETSSERSSKRGRTSRVIWSEMGGGRRQLQHAFVKERPRAIGSPFLSQRFR
jgi:hypothetical protein